MFSIVSLFNLPNENLLENRLDVLKSRRSSPGPLTTREPPLYRCPSSVTDEIDLDFLDEDERRRRRYQLVRPATDRSRYYCPKPIPRLPVNRLPHRRLTVRAPEVFMCHRRRNHKRRGDVYGRRDETSPGGSVICIILVQSSGFQR